MKRFGIICLSAMIALSMAGCSQGADTAALESENAELKEQIAALESASVTSPSVEIATATPAPTEESTPEPTEAPNVEEQLIVDQEGVQIYYTGLVADDNYGRPAVNLRIVNGSDVHWIVQTRDFAINDILTDVIFSADVAAGKTAINGIIIEPASMEQNGISFDQIQKIDFIFHVFSNDDWSIGFDTEPIVITPEGAQTQVAESEDTSDTENVPLTNASPVEGPAAVGLDEEQTFETLTYYVNSSWPKTESDSGITYTVDDGTLQVGEIDVSIWYDMNSDLEEIFTDMANRIAQGPDDSPLERVESPADFAWKQNLVLTDGQGVMIEFVTNKHLYTILALSHKWNGSDLQNVLPTFLGTLKSDGMPIDMSELIFNQP